MKIISSKQTDRPTDHKLLSPFQSSDSAAMTLFRNLVFLNFVFYILDLCNLWTFLVAQNRICNTKSQFFFELEFSSGDSLGLHHL